MSTRSRTTRCLSTQKPADGSSALEPTFSSIASGTVSVPSKRPRGRPPKNPSLKSENPRTALPHKISRPLLIPASKLITTRSSSRLYALRSEAPAPEATIESVVHERKRKRSPSDEVRPIGLQTACGGCRRRSYPHGENWEQGLVTICYKCNKKWHAQCTMRQGKQGRGAPGQWECCNCSRKVKPQPSQLAHTDNTQAEVVLDPQAQDAARKTDQNVLGLGTDLVTEELDTPRITECYGDLVDFSKITVIQAQNVFQEAEGLLDIVLTERDICRERFYKLKSEIQRYGNGLEEHRRQFHSDDVLPGDGESEHSTSHRLALGICGDKGWIKQISAKIDLIKAEERRLTERVKSLQEDVKIKKATLKGLSSNV